MQHRALRIRRSCLRVGRMLGATFAIGLSVSCAPAAPPPAPAPSPVRDTAALREQTAPPLPAIPLVEGPLAIKVVYPPPNHLIESRDSNFIFGSLGNGKATLTINGFPARVYPNGAFLAYLPNPPAALPRYDLVAVAGGDTARQALTVRVAEPRPPLSLGGPLVVDTASIAPRATSTSPLLLRGNERVRVTVRAPLNATAKVVWPGGSQQLFPVSTTDSASAIWSADVAVSALQAGATLTVARGNEALRYALVRPDIVDTLQARWVRTGEIPARPDTDRVINARPIPGGTYKWFLFPGTLLEISGRRAGYTRVKLDSGLDVWVADADLVPAQPGTLVPRRPALNAIVRSAPGWVDLVIPIGGGERPAYFVEESPGTLTVTLYGVRGNTDIINYAENDTLLRTVEWKQVLDDRAEYAVHLRQPIYGYLPMWDEGNFVLRIRRAPKVDPRQPLRGMTIVVDPGHPPAGSTGPTALYEGQAVLPVGEKLRQILEQRGATVVMTRTTNDPVDLYFRPVIARRADGNAFVSIHLNAYGDGVNPFTARNGSGTYFFNMFSEPLARPVQRGLVRHLGLPNLGVNYDNLAVVRPTWMPAVLAEGAFVIIPEQEAALRDPDFQERYALGIAEGLEEYFRWLSKQ